MRIFKKKTLISALLILGLISSMSVLEAKRKRKSTRREKAPKETKAIVKTETDTTGESHYSWKGFPETAKNPSQTKVLVEREVPKSVRPNQEFTYEIKVTNRSYYPVDEVILTEQAPQGFKLNCDVSVLLRRHAPFCADGAFLPVVEKKEVFS